VEETSHTEQNPIDVLCQGQKQSYKAAVWYRSCEMATAVLKSRMVQSE
jgi:hypothetical protein